MARSFVLLPFRIRDSFLMLTILLCMSQTAFANNKALLRQMYLSQGQAALTPILDEADPTQVRAALQVLSESFINAQRTGRQPNLEIGTSKKLLSLSAHQDASVRADAVRSLGYSLTKNPAAEEVLRTCLKDSQPEVVARAALALARLRALSSVSNIEEVLENDRWIFGKARAAAASALGSLRAPSSITALTKALTKDSFWQTRREAARALAAYRSPEAVPALISQLKYRRHWQVRYYSAIALGKIGDRSALPALKQMYNRETLDVRICETGNRSCKNLPVKRSARWAIKRIKNQTWNNDPLSIAKL